MKNTMLRREFLKQSGMAAALAALAACRPLHVPMITPGPVRPTSTPRMAGSLPASNLISRGLRRILFAPTPEDLAHAQQIGLDAFIEEQLAPDTISDPDITARLLVYETLPMSAVALAQVDPKQKPGLQLIQATLVRAAYSRRQLY